MSSIILSSLSSIIPSVTLTRQTRTTSRPSSTLQVCTWKGHCLGDTCSNENDCDNDWVCTNQTCRTCCATEAETTFRSTQTPPPNTDLTTTSSSPTLTSATPSPSSSALISATASATIQPSSGGLSTGAKAGIGVGVGVAALLIICLVGGCWIFRRRRKTGNEPYELASVPAAYQDNDRKDLYRHHQELPTRHPPAELSAVELAELHDSDIGRQREEGKITT
ncbi:hypothetical protein BU23DRAFT_573849 [Bimuria novae-zelandiae CBS 107.79]|uniref:Mid2 domain-containing protein n=1 Tax=Bimuria novae-zelandiae CBS 107.79 TaxID=1447943 RepID=A0A6A5UQC3_9PLEO|nr:hypothetical protein BU23DRAFT_573849 [Bimuria novae-zelandiae CBS 107.79]